MNKNFKRAVAGVLSASMLLTSSMINPAVASAETTINYGDALALSLYFYDGNQCGTEVNDNPLTWRGNCHTYDSEASLDNAQGLGSAEKEFIKNANGGSNTVDVSGGYHDAGDHLKFSMTMAFSSTNLAWAYNQYPEAFTETGAKDHLFDILKEMCDYFMKVTYLDDNDDVVTFCYMVGGDNDHGEWSAPETQTMNRPTYWATKSKNSTDAACQMAAALASASMAFKEVDSNYASECLKYANALQKFGSTYKNATYDGVGSYYSSTSQNDDIAWGDLWCHLASGQIDSYNPITPQQGVYNGEYDHWIYTWDKVWGGYSTLLSQLGFGDAFTNELKFEMDKQTTDYSPKYYTIGGGWGASRYNCAWQMYAMQYASATGNDQFYEYAKKNMDYLLGDNNSNTSYLIGYGESWPVHIHHRAANCSADVSQNPSAKYTLYGALIGGPTGENGTYEDKADQYSFTEPALDYNGCFIMAIAGLYDKYGNGTDKLNSIITEATEIDENHKFGNWGSDNPTETTTSESTTTEPTTTEPTTTEPTTTEPTTTEPTTTEPTTTEPTTVTTTNGGTGGYDHPVDHSGTVVAIDTDNDTITLEYDGKTIVCKNYNHFDFSQFKVGDAVDFTVVAEDTSPYLTEIKLSSVTTTEPTTTQPTDTEPTTTTTEPLPYVILGDVNGDGSVKSNDLLLLKKFLLGLSEETEIVRVSADINGDGDVKSNDLLQLKKYLLGLAEL